MSMEEYNTLMLIKKSYVSDFGTRYLMVQNVKGFRIYDLRAYFWVWFNVSQKAREESKDEEVCRTWWLHFKHGEKS